MQNMRAKLREATDADHLALHQHPLFACLTEPQIAPQQYVAVLDTFYRFYRAIEVARAARGDWPDFTLKGIIDALHRDLPSDIPQKPQPQFNGNAHNLLGALYVAHGASFGRASFSKGVMQALPDRTHHFLVHISPLSIWQNLLARIESEGEALQNAGAIEAGARRAFTCVSDLADRSLALCA